MTGNANGGQVAPTHTYVKNEGGNIVRKHVQTPIDTKPLPKDALEPTNQQNREHSPNLHPRNNVMSVSTPIKVERFRFYLQGYNTKEI